MKQPKFINEHSGIKIGDTVTFEGINGGIVKSIAELYYSIQAEVNNNPRVIVNVESNNQTYMRGIETLHKVDNVVEASYVTLQYIKGGKL